MDERTLDIKKEERKVWDILETIPDPEIPVLTLNDLGIIREVKLVPVAKDVWDCTVFITPTYSGCPAMDMIAMQIKMELLAAGYQNVKVENILSPAWTTDWMTEDGKRKLKDHGIAPPNHSAMVCSPHEVDAQQAIECPQCGSFHTELKSQFGSTPCKALYQCIDCKEPFDYFKCH